MQNTRNNRKKKKRIFVDLRIKSFKLYCCKYKRNRKKNLIDYDTITVINYHRQ